MSNSGQQAVLLVMKPLLKWVGGKRQLAKTLEALKPEPCKHYCEPFFGAGGAYQTFQHVGRVQHISDSNHELVNLYSVAASAPRALQRALESMEVSADYYNAVRAWDRTEEILHKTAIQRAARTIYLNKCGFNGLYRTNAKGQYNVPWGKKSSTFNPVDVDALYSWEGVDVRLADWRDATRPGRFQGDGFVYLDPPYDKETSTSFTSYTAAGWTTDDTRDLAVRAQQLSQAGVQVLVSNANTPLIQELFKGWNVSVVDVRRSVNSDPTKRTGQEVLIRNY